MKRPALQNKRVAVLRMAFRARKVFATLKKRASVLLLMMKCRHNMVKVRQSKIKMGKNKIKCMNFVETGTIYRQ